MLNLETEIITNKDWWKQTRKEIEDTKKEFIKSQKIGGNPPGYPVNTLKKDVLKFRFYL